ncbi:tetratricopeptide repeat protein [Ovoidimarina sediminis]|uniref:tetratricopeptide repeat protein n=1 Tax=Ovoidimarina sediminis TaxID=3079856 RepID=UPI00291025B5|nr:tetratricopeptide repeat protein [Rhodophyticola sp. MJ-SS7]MDU8943070.1 tetratricopeptide repeat protein [Rhodophyticola sp. MJ-SS7]
MTRFRVPIKSAVAALILSVTMGAAQEARLDPLFDLLREAEGAAASEIEAKIWEEWSRSGSDSMDFLLERGRKALEDGDPALAIEHFTALIDHAPDWAEAYNARATAYFQAGLYGPSLADIRETLARNPRHFGALGGLGLIFEEIGEPEGALEAYRAVEEIYPHREGLAETIRRLERSVEGEDI